MQLTKNEMILLALSIVNAIVIPWGIWVTVQIFTHKEKIAIQNAVFKGASEKLDELEDEFKLMRKEMQDSFRDVIDRLNGRHK